VAGKARYPGGSKERVRRAGDNVRNGVATKEDMDVIDLWRASHRPVLNTFQAILRNRTRGKEIFVAQRHNRRDTIFDKLTRYPSMQLSRMDDVAGCRLIFNSIEELYKFRAIFHCAHFKHKRRNDVDKYDYIKSPNARTGYRGVHDVYEYNVNSQYSEMYRGLLIEIQYRTKAQHAWATCVELVGFITENQPKFQKGDHRFTRIMQLASEIIARAFENAKSSLPDISDDEIVREFIALDEEVGFIKILRGVNASDRSLSKNKNIILIFNQDGDLELRSFRDSTDALTALFKLEQEGSGRDIVLVRGDSTEEIRFAFKSYFSDSSDFVSLIRQGCRVLSGKELVSAKGRRPGGRIKRI